ncbi:MAG: hypothetical protein V4663_06710 [Bacteroidota bacterium]
MRLGEHWGYIGRTLAQDWKKTGRGLEKIRKRLEKDWKENPKPSPDKGADI